jgi:hypothetical protein
VSAHRAGVQGNQPDVGGVGMYVTLRSRAVCVAVAASAVALCGCSAPSRHAATATLPSNPPAPSTSTPVTAPSANGVCTLREGQAVTGALRMVGGPSRAKIVPVSGIVTADLVTTGPMPTGPTGSGCHTTAKGDGRFSLVLGPGSYVISGRSPQFDGGTADCNAEKNVVVRPHPLKSTLAPIVVNVDCRRQ